MQFGVRFWEVSVSGGSTVNGKPTLVVIDHFCFNRQLSQIPIQISSVLTIIGLACFRPTETGVKRRPDGPPGSYAGFILPVSGLKNCISLICFGKFVPIKRTRPVVLEKSFFFIYQYC